MVTTEFEFLSADQRTNIHAVIWTPEDKEVRAVLQITHGMVEYIERYEDFAGYLTGQGYAVAGHDHLGHGASARRESDLGYFGEPGPDDLLIADMHTLQKLISRQYPDVPYFMLGHSMGSYMLRKYLAVYREDCPTGAILMGTGYVSVNTTKFGIALIKVLGRLFGWRHRSRLVTALTFGAPYRRYDLTGRHPENSWMTKDVSQVKKYYSNPKCRFLFTLNGYLGLFGAVLFDCKMDSVKKVPRELPILLVSGKDDPVGDCGKGVRKVYHMFVSAGSKDISLRLYPNDRHEILNETDRQKVYRDITAWMNHRCG